MTWLRNTRRGRTDKLTWIIQPPTEKGIWEKTESTQEPQFAEVASALENVGRPLFSKDPPALYWLLKDRDSGKVIGIGRRKKAPQ